MRAASDSSLGDDMDAIDNYASGWLVLDPMKGFVSANSASPEDQKLHDVLVWLMNMAAFYCNCSFEKTLHFMDFNMHFMLKYETSK